MPYNFVADGFHTMKLFSRLSSSELVRTQCELSLFLLELGSHQLRKGRPSNVG